MKTTKHSYKFKVNEVEQLEKNLNAFISNFGEPIFHKYENGAIEIYMTEEAATNGEYLQYCDNIDYLNGWLYGAVQAINKMIPIIK